jgi:hypothetical protein
MAFWNEAPAREAATPAVGVVAPIVCVDDDPDVGSAENTDVSRAVGVSLGCTPAIDGAAAIAGAVVVRTFDLISVAAAPPETKVSAG